MVEGGRLRIIRRRFSGDGTPELARITRRLLPQEERGASDPGPILEELLEDDHQMSQPLAIRVISPVQVTREGRHGC